MGKVRTTSTTSGGKYWPPGIHKHLVKVKENFQKPEFYNNHTLNENIFISTLFRNFINSIPGD